MTGRGVGGEGRRTTGIFHAEREPSIGSLSSFPCMSGGVTAMWKRSKQRYALLGFIGVSCAFAIVFLMAMYKAALIVGIVAMPFDQKTCQAVFDQVRSGTLSADRDGVVKLPSRTAWCTSDGSVYVTRRKTGALMVLFPMWRGKGRNVTGYVFCLGPSCLSPTENIPRHVP